MKVDRYIKATIGHSNKSITQSVLKVLGYNWEFSLVTARFYFNTLANKMIGDITFLQEGWMDWCKTSGLAQSVTCTLIINRQNLDSSSLESQLWYVSVLWSVTAAENLFSAASYFIKRGIFSHGWRFIDFCNACMKKVTSEVTRDETWCVNLIMILFNQTVRPEA